MIASGMRKYWIIFNISWQRELDTGLICLRNSPSCTAFGGFSLDLPADDILINEADIDDVIGAIFSNTATLQR